MLVVGDRFEGGWGDWRLIRHVRISIIRVLIIVHGNIVLVELTTTIISKIVGLRLIPWLILNQISLIVFVILKISGRRKLKVNFLRGHI